MGALPFCICRSAIGWNTRGGYRLNIQLDDQPIYRFADGSSIDPYRFLNDWELHMAPH